MKKRLLKIFTCFALLAAMTAPVFAAIEIPESTDRYVNDYMNVLSQTTVDTINEKNDQLENGAEILVLTTDYIGTDTEEFAYQVFNQWKIGDAKENNGVLIVLVIQEEKFWIATGTGVEDVLNASVLSDVIYDSLEADFDAGNYDRAVLNTFNELWRILANKYGAGAIAASNQKSGGFFTSITELIVPILIVVLVIFLIAIAMAMPRGPYRRRPYRRYRRYEPRRYEDPHRYGRPGPVIRPEPMRRPTFNSRSRSGSSSAGRSFSGRSSGMRSGGGGRSRGGGAGRK